MITFKVVKRRLPIAIVDLPHGTFAIINATWNLIPRGTQYSEIELIEEEPLPKLIGTKLSRLEFAHKSQKGPDIYNVIRKTDGTWSCNCIGFGVHKKCKHVEIYKAHQEIENNV